MHINVWIWIKWNNLDFKGVRFLRSTAWRRTGDPCLFRLISFVPFDKMNVLAPDRPLMESPAVTQSVHRPQWSLCTPPQHHKATPIYACRYSAGSRRGVVLDDRCRYTSSRLRTRMNSCQFLIIILKIHQYCEGQAEDLRARLGGFVRVATPAVQENTAVGVSSSVAGILSPDSNLRLRQIPAN